MDAVTHITIQRERLPLTGARFAEFWPLAEAHGLEVYGKPPELDLVRYAVMEREGRIGWFVARVDGTLVGYSNHFFYGHLHLGHRQGHEDLWYVRPEWRGRLIGKRLKSAGHAWLKQMGCKATEAIMVGETNTRLVSLLGYRKRGVLWEKEL
ncbi:MAG: GNAT family N-acetyltransferase [Mycobacterium sp.]|nr:GNAT family N-acetyltransferase [Mycobacterium sp.]